MKRLAIVGSGKLGTKELAPFDDLNFDIWIFNEAATSPWCKRWTALFQLHKPEIYQGVNTNYPNHWEWLRESHGKPVYMQAIDPLVPDSVAFPLDEVIALTDKRYLEATVCDVLGLAILQGYEHVEIYGVEMSMTEYKYQAECWRFWVGFAIGRLGKEHVVLHSGQHLFEGPLYGYEGAFSFGKEHFEERVKLHDADWRSADKHARNIRKVIDRAITSNEFAKMPDYVKAFHETLQSCGELAGRLAEAERYTTFGDRYADRGGFEFAAATASKKGEETRVGLYMMLGKVEYVWNVWQQTKSAQAAGQLQVLINQVGKLAEEAGAMFGMYKENVQYMMEYDDMVEANGGIK